MICPLCASTMVDGHRVPQYDITVCEACWAAALHGWPRRFEAQLFEALTRAGLLIPDRNDDGLLPRAYAPPADFSL